MGLKEKFFAMLKSMSPEEKKEVQDALNIGAEEAAEESQENATEQAPADTPADSAAENTEQTGAEGNQEAASESNTAEAEDNSGEDADNKAEPAKDDDDIPSMSKDAQAEEQSDDRDAESPAEEETELSAEPPAIQHTEGENMPIDYQQIIDGLNAKISALETENKTLRAKVEGAFGLTAKPRDFAKVNPLYDEAEDIPPMRR